MDLISQLTQNSSLLGEVSVSDLDAVAALLEERALLLKDIHSQPANVALLEALSENSRQGIALMERIKVARTQMTSDLGNHLLQARALQSLAAVRHHAE